MIGHFFEGKTFFCVFPPPRAPGPEPVANRGVGFVHGLICRRLLLLHAELGVFKHFSVHVY